VTGQRRGERGASLRPKPFVSPWIRKAIIAEHSTTEYSLQTVAEEIVSVKCAGKMTPATASRQAIEVAVVVQPLQKVRSAMHDLHVFSGGSSVIAANGKKGDSLP
jgi:hypothetical protein